MQNKKISRKIISLVLSLLMMLTVVPGMSLMALAWDGDPYAELLNTTTAVNFDGKEWYLIENNSTAANAGTVTLLAKECVAASQYNSSGSYVEYASSTVKTAVDNWYNNNITSNAKTAVFDNKMFLLTKDQANAMTTDTRKCSQASEANYNYWWLCSPGSFGNFASCVYGGNGNVLAYGYSVVYALGVRPALKLDLSKVEFDSATNTFAVASSHEHDFTYSVNGDTITATCTATGCDLTDDNEVTLTIVAPTLTIVGQTGDGISEYATLTGLEAFNEATGLNVAETDIKYYAVETYEIDGNTYKRQGNELDGAPTDAGEYIAGLTLSDVKISETATRDVTARTWYTITEPAPTYTVTWLNGDDILETDTDLEPGALPSYDGETPTKDEDDDFTYDFIGWTSGPNFYTPDELPIVDGDTTYVATFRLTAKPKPHTHSFTYSADGNVITATCTGTTGTCDLTNKQVTLTLNAPEHATYDDGKNANATITGEIPGVTTPTINYRRSDTPLSSAPTDAGTYTAWCQLGNATARVEYTVAKAVNPGYTTLPHAVENLVYTGEEQELITAGVTSTGQIAYTAGTDPENEPDVTTGGMPYSYSVPKMTNAGTYYVWCKLDGGKNYTSLGAQKIEVTIAKANPTYTVPADLTATYGDTLSDVILPEGWSWADDTQSVGNAGTKTFKATFTPEDTTNYNTVSDIDVTVTVEKADIDPTVSIENRTYGEKASDPSVEGNSGNGAVTYTYAAKGSDEFVAEAPTNAGEYTVKATIAETANYNAAVATADFTINKALLTVTAKNQTVNYGSPAAQGKYTVKGLVDGDTVDVKLYTKIATNEVKATVKASANYKVKVVSGILTIKGAPIAKAQPSGSNMLVSYTKVQKADGYDIFAGYCGSGSYPLAKTIKGNSVAATKLTKIGGKAIDTKKNVFLYVVAYKMVNGKKVTLVRSASLHIAGANTKYTNAKSIKVAKTSLTLAKGKTTTLKPTMTLVSSGKKLISCTDKFRYASCNKSIAKVDASGKITAVGKGTVNLYVYATNGVKTKVVVTVK